jgi:putative redox protein
MWNFRTEVEPSRTRLRSPQGTEILWHEFWKLQDARPNVPGVRARVTLTRPGPGQRQFVAETGGGHHFLMDDAAGGTGPKPLELVAAALAGCTASDVIATLRDRKHQRISAYEVRVEADQAERPPQIFVAVRIHHIVTGYDIDPALVSEAIQLSEAKNSAVAAMVSEAAMITTTFEVVNEAEPTANGRLAASPTPGAPMSWTG